MNQPLKAHLQIVRPAIHPSRSKAGRVRSTGTIKVKALIKRKGW